MSRPTLARDVAPFGAGLALGVLFAGAPPWLCWPAAGYAAAYAAFATWRYRTVEQDARTRGAELAWHARRQREALLETVRVRT